MTDDDIGGLDDDERRLLRTVGRRGADLAIVCGIVWMLSGCSPAEPAPDAGPSEACSFGGPSQDRCGGYTSVPVCGDAWHVVCAGRDVPAWATAGCPERGDGGLRCADGAPVHCAHLDAFCALGAWGRGPGYVEGDAGSGG